MRLKVYLSVRYHNNFHKMTMAVGEKLSSINSQIPVQKRKKNRNIYQKNPKQLLYTQTALHEVRMHFFCPLGWASRHSQRQN